MFFIFYTMFLMNTHMCLFGTGCPKVEECHEEGLRMKE
jgi:hypothetical protein